MTDTLQPYPEYKDSGLPWLGTVPRHWPVRRIKTVLRETDRRSTDGSGTLLSLTRVRGLIPHKDMTDKEHSARTLAGYKCYTPGQIVMNRMQAWSGMFGAGAIDGLVSPDYAVFDIVGGHDIKLVLERIKAPDLVGQFALESKGIGSGFNRLYTDRLGPIAISLPPPDEQAAIVRFLDHAHGRIDRAIRAKRKIITLLNEQKQAIIHRAVTRGLDPSVPLKPSGLPWLGDIPKHWKIWRLKFAASNIVDCPHATPRYSDSGTYPAIRTADISPGNVYVEKAKKLSQKDYLRWIARLEPQEGDILYSREGERFGIAACVPAGVKLCISQRMMVFRIASHHCPDFVMWLLNSVSTYRQALQDVMGATAPHVNISTIKNYFLAMPAKQEQEQIVKHIESETRLLKVEISNLEREIALLREYRTRLTADVVTGKLDVRAAAASLPDPEPVESVLSVSPDDPDAADDPGLEPEEAEA
ncbi:MAG: restriction endonuclease subunit S [Kiritimatiellia bacterium]|nr:restriction endonuclease subunit S [Kiritimatiellia bacterium]